MCTVTALPRALLPMDDLSGGRLLLRVACNRDELLTRQPALPPTVWAAGARQAVLPIDPESGGTWIAVNDAGLVFVILNANPGAPVRLGEISRGTIIPTLVGCASTSAALAQAQALRAERYSPFRLLLIDRYQLVECWPDGDRIRHRRAYLHGAIMRTSSGLGDGVVAGPRRALFQRLFSGPLESRAAQDLFHLHQWPGREAISVNMQRDEARTVSRTVVEVKDGSVSLSYQAVEWPHAVAV